MLVGYEAAKRTKQNSITAVRLLSCAWWHPGISVVCIVTLVFSCCQLSDFVAVFTEYSDPSSDSFAKKQLATPEKLPFSLWKTFGDSDIKTCVVLTLLNEQGMLPRAPSPSQSTHSWPSPRAAVPPSCSQSRRCSPLCTQTTNELHMCKAVAGCSLWM